MIDGRVFPRLNTQKISMLLNLYSFNNKQQNFDKVLGSAFCRILNISLGGLCIETDEEIDLFKCDRITITLKEKEFYLMGNQVWHSKLGDHKHLYGIKLQFNEIDYFKSWLKFVTAYDLTTNRNRNTPIQI